MSETIRVLLAEDSESDAALILRLLSKAGYQITSERIDTPAAMREALARHSWDVVIADHQMGQFNAPEALRILRETGKDIPFIIASGSIGEELAVELMKAGAHDYIHKDRLARLVPAIEREVREVRFRRERAHTEERLALAIEATQLGTFDYFPGTDQLILSDLAIMHLGLSDAKISDDQVMQALHPDDRDRVLALREAAFASPGDGQFAAEYRTIGIEDGLTRWISSWGRVYFDANGQPVRFVGVTRDITSRKTLEDQFRQAQKLENIGRLAGGIAHDFNNLLTIMNGYSDFLLEQMDAGDPLHNPLSEIRKAGGRAAELTRQLLAFSRKRVFDPKPLNLNDLISGSRNLLSRLIGEDIELVTRLAPDLGNILADGGQIYQVLMNLVVNARDAMPDGGRLTIETASQDDTVLLIVSDTGIGMDEQTSQRLFEPFFTTKREGIGTGLGLATVQGIVKQCGGSINLVTAPGQGTTFTITLPRTGSAVASLSQTQSVDGAQASETLLVVEDQDEVRAVMATVLAAKGYRVLEARNAEQAISIAQRHAGPIHLMLTDVVMPRMNGRDLANRIRAMRPRTRIVFMSGYADNVIANGAANIAQSAYIDKPFTAEALVHKVHKLLA